MGCAAGLTPGLVMASDLAPPVQESLSFKIFWQGSDIGRHVQTIVPMGGNGSFTVTTSVDMLVKVAFITAYRYEHEGQEVWREGFLQSVASRTHDDGEDVEMSGTRTAEGFETQGKFGHVIAPHNVMTSNTLWSPKILDERRVLDSQNGDVMNVSTQFEGKDKVDVPEGVEEARKYRFVTPTMAGHIWYDETGDWVKGLFKKDGEAVEYIRDA
jgi:hypothetical protein